MPVGLRDEKPIGAGPFLGCSTLAIVAAINDTNGGLYKALRQQMHWPCL